MTEREKYEIAVRAKMCGGRRGDIVTLDDGSRWRLTGLTITPAPDVPEIKERASATIHPDKTVSISVQAVTSYHQSAMDT